MYLKQSLASDYFKMDATFQRQVHKQLISLHYANTEVGWLTYKAFNQSVCQKHLIGQSVIQSINKSMIPWINQS